MLAPWRQPDKLTDKRYYSVINHVDFVMPDTQEPAPFCIESWTCFQAWMRDLSDGEATFYGDIVYGAAAGAVLLMAGWLYRRLTRPKQQPHPSEPAPQVIIHNTIPVQALPLRSEVLEQPKADHTSAAVYSDRLPIVQGGFFGREAELQMLDEAWGKSPLSPLLQRGGLSSQSPEMIEGSPPLFSPSMDFTLRARSAREKSLPTIFCEKGEQGGFSPTRILQFIAPGGTGKTKLLRHWIDHTPDIPNLIAWSFYSQGASEDKQTSATPFFTHAFAKLGSTRERFASEEDKGEHLAELLLGKRCLLVLDGLEPLQHSSPALRGELKDKAIRQLLRQLARHPDGLCVITTRIAVHELSDRQQPVVISHDLQNLCAADGVRLLQALGVTGSQVELGKAVREYGGHALALSLLGNAVSTYLDGDILKRDTLDALIDAEDRAGHHAFKVMRAYQHWLQGTAELKLLYLLGLFDHPVETEVVQVLWAAQIPGLTDGIAEKSWKAAIHALRDQHRLLSAHAGQTDLLDCHPLIREYFGGQLKAQQPEGWRQAHERLYGYYKALPEKELPDTLEEMQPLFSAVAHGCAAGLHQQALDEVYWPRIQRKDVYFLYNKLGAFSDDLATISHFFTPPWQSPAAGLAEAEQAVMLSRAGFGLRALGRLREALEPMQASVDVRVKQKEWKAAAVNASNLSELQLTLGEVAAARESGQRSVDYADQSGDMFSRMGSRTTHADALHQAGEAAAALALFREAEQLQQEHQPEYPRLYSLQGFQYCDLLLAQGGTAEVLERAEEALNIVLNGSKRLLDIALNQLTLGRAHLQQLLSRSTAQRERGPGGEGEAAHWLEQAVAGLRAAGQQDDLPRGLLARAALHRATGDFARARQDLQEVFDIANGSGMRLHLTDWHLEMARLLLEENPPCSPFSQKIVGSDFSRAERARRVKSMDGLNKGGNPPVSTEPDWRALPFEKGETEGISYHLATAAKLIAATGYHRRDAELAELQSALR